MDELAERLGARPAAGGRHFEIIAADPEQDPPSEPLPFALDRVRLPRLVGWAGRTADIHQHV